MRTDGQTDSQKLVVAFHNFAKAPKKAKVIFNGFNSYLHGFSDFVFYRPANPLFGSSPAHLFQPCEFPFLSVSHIPFVANFRTEFQAYYDKRVTHSEIVTFSGVEIRLDTN